MFDGFNDFCTGETAFTTGGNSEFMSADVGAVSATAPTGASGVRAERR